MADVTCEISELSQARPTHLAICLSAVSDVRPFVQKKTGPQELILVAKYGEQISDRVREWNFPSIVRSIECRYMERWLQSNTSQSEYKLRLVHFYLYQHYGPDELPKEVLAFHWEPIPDHRSDDEDGYRERPHLHVGLAPAPLPRSHFVVTLTVPSERQANVGYLNELLDAVFKMVGVEVLDRIRNRPNGWL